MCCGRPDTTKRSSREAPRREVDPTRAVWAAARPMYVVLPHSGVPTSQGKRFTILANAEDYARRIHGIVRPV